MKEAKLEHKGWRGRVELCCGRCSAWIMRDSDSPEDIRIKRGLTPVAMFLLLFAVYSITHNFLTTNNPIFIGSIVFYAAAMVQFLAQGCLGRGMKGAVDVLIGLSLVGIVLTDLGNVAELGVRVWSFVVLLLDIALVFNTPRTIPIVISITLVYLLVERLEAGVRFGLYDVFSFDDTLETCDCAHPPCARGVPTAGLGWTAFVVVLVIDFYFTRGFAADLRCQVRRVGASVEVAGDIAAALARYDIEGAHKAITSDHDLPKELAHSFLHLLANLRSYRAYLPHSCLVREAAPIESPSVGASDPPCVTISSTGGSRTGALAQSSQGAQRSTLSGHQSSLSAPRSVLSAPHSALSGHQSALSGGSDGSASTISSGISVTDSDPALASHKSFTKLRSNPRRARVSLAAGNMVGYLAASGDLAGEGNARWIGSDVERWCVAVMEAKGVVDLIQGDRRYASFNARQACGEHASAAVEVLSSRGEGVMCSGCVVTGMSVCGDFGSTAVMRYMVLGGVASSLHPFERIAARWETKVLCEAEAYSAACYRWDGELLGAVFMAKRGDRPLRLYNMTSRRGRGNNGPEEWMYELENMGEGKHADANKARDALIKAKLDTIRQQTHDEESQGGVVWRVTEVGMAVF
eukprot:Hpha_TRINITY_DN16493_c3_g1::TRINITY_DN16493_c3_g1_i1::g.159815::m.159815